jgi:hypothetical protein
MRRHRLGWIALAVIALTASACSSSKKSSSSAPSSAGSSSASGAPGAFAKAHYTTSLSGVCPNPVIIQTDWLPEADHGGMYQMIGGGGKKSQYTYTGPLGSTGIDLEIVSGGPGLGNGANQPSSLYAGNLVKNVTPQLAFVSETDSVAYSKQFPVTAVFATYQKSPQAILFDPTKYPTMKTIADIKAAVSGGAKIYVTAATFSYVRWLIGQGIPESAFIGGYAGDLEKFVGGAGSILNQGYSTNEIYTLEKATPTWNKPVGYVYIADLGFSFYQSSVSVATNKLAQLTPCLQKLVPIMQHATADYLADPTEVNQVLADYNAAGLGAAFWKTPVALNKAATDVMKSDSLIKPPAGIGVGGFDTNLVAQVVSTLVPIDQAQNLTSLNPNVQASDVATNQFIDNKIQLSS